MSQSDPPEYKSPLYSPRGHLWIPAPQDLEVGKTEKIVDTKRVAGLIRDALDAPDDLKQQLLDEALEQLGE